MDKFEILFEDEDLLVINKPHNLTCAPSKAHFYDNLGKYVAEYLNDKNFVLRLLYRLDKDTAGIILIAKSLNGYKSVFNIDKEYYALCEGNFTEQHILIDKPILTKTVNGRNILKREISNQGKVAKTQAELVCNFENYALVKFKLLTGRTHQIRVHMSSILHPLLCDPLYNDITKNPNYAFLILKKVSFLYKGLHYNFEVDFPNSWSPYLKNKNPL